MKVSSLVTLLTVGCLTSAAMAGPAPTTVVVFDHAQVDNAFAQGMRLADNDSYKISAGRRVMAGIAELHDYDTDIFHVQAGEATFVTGGTIVEGKSTGPGETRGTSITGGTTHQLVKGDMIVIPAGTPHQFTGVSGTFLYLVIKVTR